VSDAPVEAFAPSEGIWRIARGDKPLFCQPIEPDTLNLPHAGNRFDSEDFGVLYFGSNLEACFGEVLARFRPDLTLLSKIPLREEWEELGFMDVGAVPAEWRHRRVAVRVTVDGSSSSLPFLDLDHVETLEYLRPRLALGLSELSITDLDVSTVRGPDRRVTRLVSGWAYRNPSTSGRPYAGIRYSSRLDSKWECWAVFHDVELEVQETRPIEPLMSEMQTVSNVYGITVH
jgi:hypothetical protein